VSEKDNFEVSLYYYKIELNKLRLRLVRKYGEIANDWFGIK